MDDKIYPKSGISIRRTIDFLPTVFKTETNEKFFAGTLDSLTQPGTLEKTIGFVGRRYGKTYNSKDIYLDSDDSLRSRYQLEPAAVVKKDREIKNFYDYLDFKNQLKFFGNHIDRDDLITKQNHYSWDPPIDWDKLVNFREYYWVPDGPPIVKIFGQAQSVVSAYRVMLGTGSTFVFTPDGFKNNPTIVLYRGQTYKFIVNAPDNGFVIRTAYDSGSLEYKPGFPYSAGQFAVYDGKLWRARVNIPAAEASTTIEGNDNWEYVEDATGDSPLDYNGGVENNGLIQGELVFEVPLDAPDLLYYQSFTDPDRFGKFVIADISANTKIDVEKEIIGKENYLSSNDVQLMNGMSVVFEGLVTPEKYSEGNWIVEGVGEKISLVRFQDLVPPRLSDNLPEVLFDNDGFDTLPFDEATSYPSDKDYITINRASLDSNAWSRYNRWFHKSVLEFSHKFNGSDFDAVDSSRAKRPIIEFRKNLRLFNHGIKAKKVVDFVDTFTDDVFSNIEGSQGYYVDGEELYQGARVLFTADTDKLVNNRIYEVNFINHNAGSAPRQNWNPSSFYRVGDVIRFNGQAFRAAFESPFYEIEVLSSNATTKRFRIVKNPNIKENMAIEFSGSLFGNVNPEIIYFILSVDNSDPLATEFVISTQKQGFEFRPSTSSQGLGSMKAFVAAHPTDSVIWNPALAGRQINLKKVEDSEPKQGECILVRRGSKNRGLMYHYTQVPKFDESGTTIIGKEDLWIVSQRKTKVNQSPEFEVYDREKVSFGDVEKYPVTSFKGSKIVSYREGNSVKDSELGFSLSYLNIDNVGDLLFNFDWDFEEFSYEVSGNKVAKKISTGFYQTSDSELYGNCWVDSDIKFYQPILDTIILEENSDIVELNSVKWSNVSEKDIYRIIFFVNGLKYKKEVLRENNQFKFSDELKKGDVVSIKIYSSAIPESGYYEMPIGLERNPLNQELRMFTLGQATDHVLTAIDLFDSFEGNFPGESNLGNLDGFQPLLKRFVKHSSIAPLSIVLLSDKKINLIKSLEFSNRSYREFKNKFLQLAETLDYGQNPINAVDEIMEVYTKVKQQSDAFSDSDMIGTGAYNKISYTVDDEGIKVFALSQKFDLSLPSRTAVYVYLNGVQLLVNKQYTFNQNFGFVELLVDLQEDDRIEIREYLSTSFCFIPATPTKLGLYKKYMPRKFFDDTYLEPTEVIQGHDGSIMIAHGDFRDDIILELETRIYNNIKVEYDTKIFDVDKLFGGYYGNSIFNKQDLDRLIAKYFRQWTKISSIDFTENEYFDTENSFTFSYNRMTDPSGDFNLPGWWRGVYRWFYDTDRPHLMPWEMLGFSEEPDWWRDQYGPPPYTSNNLILWEDLRDGIVRKGNRRGIHLRYSRPTLISHIPVDGDGNLLSPLDSGLSGNFSLVNSRDGFRFGDYSPVENSWRSSSEWPFVMIIACCLTQPFEFISRGLDRTRFNVNDLNQLISLDSGLFFSLSDIKLSEVGGNQTSGLINFIADYLKSRSIPLKEFESLLQGLDVNLSTRLSGFVDKSQQKYILDSKNPRSKNNTVFVPPENYDIIFNSSVPIKTLIYSGIIIEKSETGYKVYGYDSEDPVFSFYGVFSSQGDILLSIGGVSANFVEWEPGVVFPNGTVVRNADVYYRSLRTHTSGDSFDLNQWKRLAELPRMGAVEAFRRMNIDRSSAKFLEYGTVFKDIQSLVDFIVGYQAYLEDQGFIFDGYDSRITEPLNWYTSIKEFLFWTKHSWSIGSLLSLSPASSNIKFTNTVGVAENLLDSFYDYQVFKADGTVLSPGSINVFRTFQETRISPENESDGIFFLKTHIILKEHVTIFSDRTVFNDVIYDKTTGYRQDRIKSRGFRTVDWDGDYTSPGFLFDNIDINPWIPYTDYKLGDIVSYRSFNWVSLENQKGLDTFNESLWSKLDSFPERELVPNFDFRISQFEDFYDLDSDGTGSSQRELARHAVGYQAREYLQDIAEDQVTQFKIFQGFLKEKGTKNSLIKVFDKLGKSNRSKIQLNEEWAFRVGDLGGKDQVSFVEFNISKDRLKVNPQPLIVVDGAISERNTDVYYRINNADFNFFPSPFSKNINSLIEYDAITRSAGYVNPLHVDLIVKTRNDLLSINIQDLKENSHIWVTFDNDSWTVLKFNFNNTLMIRRIDQSDRSAIIFLSKRHNFKLNEIIGIKGIVNLVGFYRIISVQDTSFTIDLVEKHEEIIFNQNVDGFNLYTFTETRYKNFNDVDQRKAALLKDRSKLWIDDGYSDKDRWTVVEKTKQFSNKNIGKWLVDKPTRFGTTVLYADKLKQSIIGAPGSSFVYTMIEFNDRLELNQIIAPVFGYGELMNESFGESIAVSPDNKWLAIGAPRASGVKSRYRGLFVPFTNYQFGDIVSYQGKIWECLVSFNDSSIEFNSVKWKIIGYVPGNLLGNPGPVNQGIVTLYRWFSNQWINFEIILSPNISANEFFGSKISISGSDDNYFMAVSATGSSESSGRVYLFKFKSGIWKSIDSDSNYQGIFDGSLINGSPRLYEKDSIVWYDGNLWITDEDFYTDGSLLLDSTWKKIDSLPIRGFLPSSTPTQNGDNSLSIGVLEDSTLPTGIEDYSQLVENINLGDKFGETLAMSRDGNLLIIGAPNSDTLHFENYRGEWNPIYVYKAGDVVRFFDEVAMSFDYRELIEPDNSLKPFVSIGQTPNQLPWQVVEGSGTTAGKIFIYKKDENDFFRLIQIINSSTLESINDTDQKESLASGDRFGYSLDIDSGGNTLIVSSPVADVNFLSQGSVYVFKYGNYVKASEIKKGRRYKINFLGNTNFVGIGAELNIENKVFVASRDGNPADGNGLVMDEQFILKQKLISFEDVPNEFFGSSISISPSAEKIVVGAKNARYQLLTFFDDKETFFDENTTIFLEDQGFSGQVYIYDKKDQIYFLTEKLDADLQESESFGSSIDNSEDIILVGSPSYKEIRSVQQLDTDEVYSIFSLGDSDWYSIGVPQNTRLYPGVIFSAINSGAGTGLVMTEKEAGNIRLFRKIRGKKSWQTIEEESDLVDLSKIKNISVYDNIKNENLGSIDFVDNYKLKIISLAEQELKFKTVFDPAVYTQGTIDHEIDGTQAWFETHVGELWWDLSTVKFQYYEQSDLSFRIGNWNRQVFGSSVDIYEWVESKILPSAWFKIADTVEGLAQGISGTPKYLDDTVYSSKIFYNPITGEPNGRKYYFWVKNKTTVAGVSGRRNLSAVEVKELIESPHSKGIPFIAIVDADKFLLYNFNSLLKTESASINIEINKGYENLNPIHHEYQLLTEGKSDSLPTAILERKWIDSLVGYDIAGNKVPDNSLNEKQKYGVLFRPRQSMFTDRFEVLETVIDNINAVLMTRSFSDVIDYSNLKLVDEIPDEILREYDLVVDRQIDLQNIGTTRIRRPILKPIIINGALDNIEIVDSGFGYKIVPRIFIEGDGIGAEASVTLDEQGRIKTVLIISQGRKYSSAVIKIRNFSVLVRQDETVGNYWVIYAWDDVRKVFEKSKIQGFNTERYWEYSDWYAAGYGITTRIVTELENLYQEPTVYIELGNIIKVREYADGGWALLEKIEDGTGDVGQDYKLVGRKNGTIQIKKDEFLLSDKLGFDNIATYDGTVYDLQPTKELRNIFNAVKEDIFVGDLQVEWNKLFFTSIRYAFVQQPKVDWAFKTSFLDAIYNIGELDQRVSYKNDNLDSYQKYLEEVKPYRTTVRQYISSYDKLDKISFSTTDFDTPPFFLKEEGRIVPVNEFVSNVSSYPWKYWLDNRTYSIVEILINDPGDGYIEPPSVLIEGDGIEAVARAYISNGRVSGIVVLNPGKNFTRAPLILLVGGNGTSPHIAKAVAVIGNGLTRSMTFSLKFDRLSSTSMYDSFVQEDTFLSKGNTSSFDLSYAPTTDKSKIKISRSNERLRESRILLNNEYRIDLYIDETSSYKILKGKIIFFESPREGDKITISYEKNDVFLDAASRVEKYYFPDQGMKGKELSQLMTGVDFGGVQIQGTTFDITGGWDALPWFTDNWDSVEPSSDFYYVVDGTTLYVELPYTPSFGQQISIYLKRISTLNQESEVVRIDDPKFGTAENINKNSLMPTFVGDGSSKVVEFIDNQDQPYLDLSSGDLLIFRTFESDGSVIINDPNIIDTRVSGGTLSAMEGAYATATGKTAEEITIDGYKFISPEQVPAPEENVPGQVLESLSIKVFHSTPSGSAPLQSSIFVSDGVRREYDIRMRVFEFSSILVYVDKIRVEVDDSLMGYEVDFVGNSILFTNPPAVGSVIEIISIGIGGVSLLDYQEFVADGKTDLFLTKALYNQTSSVVVTVDGIRIDALFLNSTEYTDTVGRTLVQLGRSPSFRQVVKVIVLSEGSPADSSVAESIIRVNRQTIIYDGSTQIFELDNFVNLPLSSATSSLLVDVNGRYLKSPDTVLVTYDGNNNIIPIGTDPRIIPGTITFNEIEVYINDVLQPPITVYTFNVATNVLTVNSQYLSVGDQIKILMNLFGDYSVKGRDLVIRPDILSSMKEDDVIEVIWFSEYPTFGVITDVYSGGKIRYSLGRKPVNSSYVWIYKNGERLSLDRDYSVEVERSQVQLRENTIESDTIMIVEYGQETWDLPASFEIYKDMLNIYHFKRYSTLGLSLAKEINYYDQHVEVNNGDLLFAPIRERNIPGVIFVNNEKIEYLSKQGNILSQLRRGSLGTSIPELHRAGSPISDSGPVETIPYSDKQEKWDFFSDGTSLEIGPLSFIPIKSTREFYRIVNEVDSVVNGETVSEIFYPSIPIDHGACDQIEVFVGGRRLRKDPIEIYDENRGPIGESSAVKTVEADFSVDGERPFIRLTEPVKAGVRITIVRRVGKIWYNASENTAATGSSLNKNRNPITDFIFKKTTILPE